MPADDRLGSHNGKGANGRGEPATEPDKQQAIDVCHGRSLRYPPPKHVDLLPQDQNLSLQLGSRLKERGQEGKQQPEQVGHQTAILRPLLMASTPNRIFGAHTGVILTVFSGASPAPLCTCLRDPPCCPTSGVSCILLGWEGMSLLTPIARERPPRDVRHLMLQHRHREIRHLGSADRAFVWLGLVHRRRTWGRLRRIATGSRRTNTSPGRGVSAGCRARDYRSGVLRNAAECSGSCGRSFRDRKPP